MSVRKIHGSWWIDFRHEFTRYRKRSPENSRAGALAYEAMLRGKLAAGISLEPPRVHPRLRDFVERWLATYVVPNNKPSEQHKKRQTFARHILPVLGGLRLDELTSRHVEQYKAQKLQEGLKPKTVNNHLTMLRRCLDCAVEWEELAHIPKVRWLKAMKPVMRFLSEEEAARLLAASRAIAPMVFIALHTGLRVGELLGLTWDDVQGEHRLLIIQRSIVDGIVGTPKNHRSRTVPFGEEVAAALRELAGRGTHPSRRVFLNESTGEPLTRSQANERLFAACVRAGLPRFGWHTLRHTFATQLVAKGAPLRAVQELLGHSTITMTERYAHVAPTSLRAAVDLLSRGQPVVNSTPSAAELRPEEPDGEHVRIAVDSEKTPVGTASSRW